MLTEDETGLANVRIALVVPLPPPPGGMANQARQLQRLLEEAGVQVETVRMNSPYTPRWVARIRGLRALFRLVPYLCALWRSAAHVSLFHVFANSGWSWHLFAAPAIWIGRLRGVPVIVNYRGGAAETFFGRSWWLVRPSLRCASLITVPSGFLEEIFRRRGICATIVPNIIDLSRFSSSPANESGAGTGGPSLLVTRNLEALYDNATAIKALQRIRDEYPDARLTIAGEGPERNSLEQLARQLGLADAVQFTGKLDNSELPALYQRADISLNPSLTDNMPISVLESLASGVPVVSTSVGGVPYLLEDGRTGLLVPPGDPDAMAKAVLGLLQDASLADRLRKNGALNVQKYTWENVMPILFAAYRQALDNGASR